MPYDRGDLVSRVHAEGEVLSSRAQDDGTHVRAKVSPVLRSELDPYVVAPDAPDATPVTAP